MLADQNHRRFSIDKNSCIVDKAFPSHHRRKYKYYGDPNDSDSDIRRNLLWQGIRRLLPKLIVGSKASTIRHCFGYMLLAALEASQLNTLDPLVAIQHPFNGKLHRKEGMQDYTSISLFIRGVERLLRELYGDLNRTELDMALYAVRQIVVGFSRFVGPDLAAEYDDAESIDYRVGIGRPEGYGVRLLNMARLLWLLGFLPSARCKLHLIPGLIAATQSNSSKRSTSIGPNLEASTVVPRRFAIDHMISDDRGPDPMSGGHKTSFAQAVTAALIRKRVGGGVNRQGKTH